jgi:peptidoglycan/LPS O-acetylase OafA/YrhL
VAILGVVFLHYFPTWFRAAVLGVDLFFVLSGFLLTRLMLEERQRYGSVSLRNFYAKRIARLGPGMVMLVVPTLIGALLFLREQRTELLWGSLASITFTNNWFRVFNVNVGGLGHLWSIACEEQFYLLWPLIVLAAGIKVRRMRNVAAFIVVAAALNVVVRSLFGEQYEDLFYGLDARPGLMLIAGCWLATVLPTQGIKRLNLRLLSVVLVLTLMVRAYFTNILGMQDYKQVWRYGGIQLTAPAMMIVIIAVMELGWVRRLLVGRPLRWLGRLAYSIFLWHQPVEMFVKLEFVNALWVRNLIYFGLSLVLAYVGNRIIEQPARAYIIRRFGDSARRPSTV